jgi:hypothetical protein
MAEALMNLNCVGLAHETHFNRNLHVIPNQVGNTTELNVAWGSND